MAKELGIIIIWNYFIAGHGKQVCDSEIGRIKQKLDDYYVPKVYKGFENNAKDIHRFCTENLIWECNGKQILSRQFHLREVKAERLQDFEPVKDLMSFRNVMWLPNGNFYTKHISCACTSCVLNPSLTHPCKYKKLSEPWILTSLTKKIWPDVIVLK